MSKLQKSVLKQSQQQSDFISDLNTKLNQLTLNQSQTFNNLKIPNSPSSPLSRQESRQNSLISIILNPDSDVDGDGDSNNTDNNQSSKFEIYGVEQLISSLTISNKLKLSSNERDLILSHLYRMLITDLNDIYLSPNGINDQLFIEIFNLLPLDKFQWEVWIRCLSSMICIDIDSIGDEVLSKFFPYLLKWCLNIINGGEQTSNEINFYFESIKLKSFAISLLIMYHNSENYSMLKNVAMMMLLLQSNIKLTDDLIDSICDVIGISLGLAFESGRNCNDIIFGTFDDIGLLKLLELLLIENDQNKSLRLKLTTLVTLCFECVTKKKNNNNNDDDDDYDDKMNQFNNLIKIIENFNNQGIKKQGKNQKDSKNLISLCLKSMKENDKKIIFNQLPLSKTKFIKIKSIITLYRLDSLKFALLGNVRLWVIKNKDLRDMLKLNSPIGGNGGGDDDNNLENENNDSEEDDDDNNNYKLNSNKNLSNKERTKLINRERDIKNRDSEVNY